MYTCKHLHLLTYTDLMHCSPTQTASPFPSVLSSVRSKVSQTDISHWSQSTAWLQGSFPAIRPGDTASEPWVECILYASGMCIPPLQLTYTMIKTSHVKCHQAWCMDISCDMGPEIPLMYCMLSAMKWSFIIFNKSFGIWNLFNYEPVQHWSMNPGSSRIF